MAKEPAMGGLFRRIGDGAGPRKWPRGRAKTAAAVAALFGGGVRRLLLGHAPELEGLDVDRFFDCAARQVMRRSAVGTDHPGRLPGAVLRRQLAARGIAREGTQV